MAEAENTKTDTVKLNAVEKLNFYAIYINAEDVPLFLLNLDLAS